MKFTSNFFPVQANISDFLDSVNSLVNMPRKIQMAIDQAICGKLWGMLKEARK